MKYYCGPYWFPEWARKLLSCPFNRACELHDMMYASKYVSRQDADIIFLEEMLRISKGRFLHEVYACVLFIMVRIGGKLSWDQGK